MRLGEAITRAAKFAAKEPDHHGRHCLRIIPAQYPTNGVYQIVEINKVSYPVPLVPGRIVATNGTVMVVCALDVDVGGTVPNALADAKTLSKVVGLLGKKTPFTLELYEESLLVRAFGEQRCLAPTLAPGVFPAIPKFPESFAAVPDWSFLEGVVHAASKDDALPEYQCVHFTPKFTEATDTLRVARVPYGLFDEGRLVPRALFENWPGGNVAPGVATSGNLVFFVHGDEVRCAQFMSDKGFMDLSSDVPVHHFGYVAQIDGAKLARAVKGAHKLSDIGVVQLAFATNSVHLSGVMANGVSRFSDVLEAPGAQPGVVALRAKFLLEAVDAAGAGTLQLGYVSATAPVRVESGHHIEVIWPMRPGA